MLILMPIVNSEHLGIGIWVEKFGRGLVFTLVSALRAHLILSSQRG